MTNSGERRATERHRATVLAMLHRPDGTSHRAVVRDASATGAGVLTRASLAVGDAVVLEIHVPPTSDHGVRAPGRVVRNEPWEQGDLWRFALGLTFDEPLDCVPDLAAIGDEQARALRGP